MNSTNFSFKCKSVWRKFNTCNLVYYEFWVAVFFLVKWNVIIISSRVFWIHPNILQKMQIKKKLCRFEKQKWQSRKYWGQNYCNNFESSFSKKLTSPLAKNYMWRKYWMYIKLQIWKLNNLKFHLSWKYWRRNSSCLRTSTGRRSDL